MFNRHPGTSSPVLPQLRQANARMSLGDYLSAAGLYEAMMKRADVQNRPSFAFICLEAGRARLQLGQGTAAFAHFRRGLEVLSEGRRYVQLYHCGQRIKTELEQRDMGREARQVISLVQSTMPAAAELPTQVIASDVPALPASCPTCNGALRLMESQVTAPGVFDCPLCDSPIHLT